eukprot:TRINITY_DN58892_c0_g1_i1.p1 TRINITY_DN58892_c0_g1~~TRINITY_DN58892_c0_g1_i1.p1  ORF type:complete len:315 (-),score=38.25 TRINITY_DN58892_c0_g1_i1:318-1262(-)
MTRVVVRPEVFMTWEKLFESAAGKDVSIRVDNGSEERCHSVVLTAASDVLGAMLATEMREGRERCIKVHDVSIVALRVFLRLLYTGSLEPDDWLATPGCHRSHKRQRDDGTRQKSFSPSRGRRRSRSGSWRQRSFARRFAGADLAAACAASAAATVGCAVAAVDFDDHEDDELPLHLLLEVAELAKMWIVESVRVGVVEELLRRLRSAPRRCRSPCSRSSDTDSSRTCSPPGTAATRGRGCRSEFGLDSASFGKIMSAAIRHELGAVRLAGMEVARHSLKIRAAFERRELPAEVLHDLEALWPKPQARRVRRQL